jgi:hypothetical protein
MEPKGNIRFGIVPQSGKAQWNGEAKKEEVHTAKAIRDPGKNEFCCHQKQKR